MEHKVARPDDLPQIVEIYKPTIPQSGARIVDRLSPRCSAPEIAESRAYGQRRPVSIRDGAPTVARHGRAGSRTKGLLMAYKLLALAQVRWRRLDGAHHLPLVRAGSPRETRAADRWRVGRTVPSIILSPA
jgi:hypothetical protein